MKYYVDSHIHSRYSRATSKTLDLETLALWATKKGLHVLGTGDFTHPAWFSELQEKLEPAEPGLFRLKEGHTNIRFMLTVEISTIYKKSDKTRKIHHIVYAEDFAAAKKIIAALDKIGNLKSDGRPILGLDSRNLLEIVLNAGDNNYLVPAHIWTPWFAVLGSKSGFDSISDCYGDLSDHIFALETGLSSDPYMNWRVSSLDKYRLISNSDAHSPAKLGREATLFDTELSYFAIKEALISGNGYLGTVEFFPEEGKYHLDGHRKCNICLTPEETLRYKGICPVCGEKITVGVLHRVNALADKEATPPATAGEVISLIPLAEIISEIYQKGVNSKTVQNEYERLLHQHGSELDILQTVPLDDFKGLLKEALARLRREQVIKQEGYDGEYGVIKLFSPEKLANKFTGGLLFDFPKIKKETKEYQTKTATINIEQQINNKDKEQDLAISTIDGALLITAGPGSGKTRTLTERIAYMVNKKNINPQKILMLTFTRRAAQEMRDRLQLLLPKQHQKIAVHTFHSLCYIVLKHEQLITEEIDFDNVIILSIELLQKKPHLLQHFCYLSIDEYQDIDATQYQLIKLLTSKNSNLCVIGDPNQAIYKFRGGDASYFNNFVNDYPNATAINLKYNYRSTETIVTAANQVINTNNIALKKGGDKIITHIAKNARREAEFIVNTIVDLIGGHNFHAIDSGKTKGQETHYSFADFAILYRTKAQAQLIQEAFTASSMPCINYSTDLIIANPQIAELLSDMRNNTKLLKEQLEQLNDQNSLLHLKNFAEQVNYDREKFFTDIQFLTEADTMDKRGDYISLMTLHAAKGLEFKVVFIAGIEDGLLPFYFGNKKDADLDEEQRLFYVGITRAKEKLYLTRSERRPSSPFLKKISSDLTTTAQIKTRKFNMRYKQLSLDFNPL